MTETAQRSKPKKSSQDNNLTPRPILLHDPVRFHDVIKLERPADLYPQLARRNLFDQLFERRRQQLQNERPQQMRFAVEQVRQCLPAQRPRHKVRHTPSGIADATGATLWVARAALDEASRARPRARGSEINTKWLR